MNIIKTIGTIIVVLISITVIGYLISEVQQSVYRGKIFDAQMEGK